MVDLIIADPPYGMNKKTVLNDNLINNDLLEFNKKFIKESFKYLNDFSGFYIFGNSEPLFDIYSDIIKPKQEK